MRIIASTHLIHYRPFYDGCANWIEIFQVVNAWVCGVHEGWTYNYDLLHEQQEV